MPLQTPESTARAPARSWPGRTASPEPSPTDRPPRLPRSPSTYSVAARSHGRLAPRRPPALRRRSASSGRGRECPASPKILDQPARRQGIGLVEPPQHSERLSPKTCTQPQREDIDSISSTEREGSTVFHAMRALRLFVSWPRADAPPPLNGIGPRPASMGQDRRDR